MQQQGINKTVTTEEDMNLDFIAGLIDADGSLYLSLEKASENRFG